ncbi:hypothetical protein [Hanstruepera flava]|uniref:hypothetical protein n=1 Tax=Hanstruepera flava TaxID=2930218 RepID=UPI002028DBC1|nr:hypothetical protein [Hanstruepera flava]
MARQKGIFKITGTLGDVNFYVIKGIGYARKAGGGFNGEAIRTQPNMQRVRENASEFGHCSQVKKAFRLALMPFLHGYRHNKLHARMMTLFTSIKALDTVSERGKRRVTEGLQTAKGRYLLRQFAFTPQHSLLDALKRQATFDWNTQRLTINDFAPKAYKAPKAATHLGVTLGVLDFDFDSLEHSLAVSPTHFIEVDAGTTSFELEPEQVVVPSHVGIVVLGVRFYEVIETEVYGLDSMIGVGLLVIRV